MTEQELERAVGGLPPSIEPPRDLWPGIEARLRRRRWTRYWIPLAAAAVLVFLLMGRNVGRTWDVTRLAGRPRLGTGPLAATGRIRPGEWLETDDSSRALIAVGRIGRVEVEPKSRIQLVTARPDDHRLALARGAIDAAVEAIPRLFFIETPAGTAIDLGCAYTLETDSAGNGSLRVTRGEVQFQAERRSSRVPVGSSIELRPRLGPGIPFVTDAPAPLVKALIAFDFERGGARATRTVLALARPEDALSLWHLLQRVDPPLRGTVYDRLAALVPPPAGLRRGSAIALDSATLDAYWAKIQRIQFRRMILQGRRDIDPRTGTTKARP